MAEAIRVLSGAQPSGSQIHIGNYLGAMRRWVDLARTNDSLFCIVDLHALTSVTDPAVMRENTLSLAAGYLAIGIDPAKTIIFRQSDVPAHAELCWYLACQFPLGLLERAHSIKDARAKGQSPNSGLLFYPVLQAADILLYKATRVPVGPDQKQHLEMAREIAQKFNAAFGEIFPLPEPMIQESTGVIPGLDGRKMSKSYDNFIGLFEDGKSIKKKVAKIVTDSKGVEDIKDPDSCSVFNLYKLFATPDEQAALRARYLAPGMGYGHAKDELVTVIERMIAPLRDKYLDLRARPDDLRDVLAEGSRRARAIADRTIGEVRDAQGIGPYLG